MEQKNVIQFPASPAAKIRTADPALNKFHLGANVTGAPGHRNAGRAGHVLAHHICPLSNRLHKVLVQWQWVRSWVNPSEITTINQPTSHQGAKHGRA